MSNGGVYKILISQKDGLNNRQDKFLIANKYLSDKLVKTRKEKKYKLKKEVDGMTLLTFKYDVELKSPISKERRILILNKIKKLNDDITNLKNKDTEPLVADINRSHHLFLQSSFKPFVSIGYEYSKATSTSIPNFGGSVKLKIPKYGDFFNDMVIYVRMTGLKPINPVNKVQYCNFLGHRLFKKVKFITNNLIIDEYTSEDYNFHYQFDVPDYKKNGWKKCVGQEVPVTAHLTADPLHQNFRQEMSILNGPQTLKDEHPEVEMFIPLLFWFKDPKLAIPNMTIPFGQTFLEFDIATRDEICACADYASDGGLFDTPRILDFQLYTNHIYLNPDVLDIFIKRIGITLIRVHKQQEMILNQPFNEILLNELKYPIETMYIAFRPTDNMTGTDNMNTWNLNSNLTRTLIPTPVMHDPTNTNTYVLGSNSIIYNDEAPVVSELGLMADNISIFHQKSSLFYNSYLPYQYGLHISTPADKSTYMFTFNFDPNSYQPTGYLNLSKIRRFYIYYKSNVIGPVNTCKMMASAKCINFLLVQNQTISLSFNV